MTKLSLPKKLWLKGIDEVNYRRHEQLAKKHTSLLFEYLQTQEQTQARLFMGYPKSGNTWARFLLYNYLNIRHNQATETLSYKELNHWQNLELSETRPPQTETFQAPALARTHMAYASAFDRFEAIYYIYRNPLDTLVSSYFFFAKRKVSVHSKYLSQELQDINFYVRYNLKYWLRHMLRAKAHATLLFSYEALKADTAAAIRPFIAAFEPDGVVDEAALAQSVAFSSFGSIKKMGREKKQEEGMGRNNKEKVEFTRSGTVGDYVNHLSADTIAWVKAEVARAGLHEVIFDEI